MIAGDNSKHIMIPASSTAVTAISFNRLNWDSKALSSEAALNSDPSQNFQFLDMNIQSLVHKAYLKQYCEKQPPRRFLARFGKITFPRSHKVSLLAKIVNGKTARRP